MKSRPFRRKLKELVGVAGHLSTSAGPPESPESVQTAAPFQAIEGGAEPGRAHGGVAGELVDAARFTPDGLEPGGFVSIGRRIHAVRSPIAREGAAPAEREQHVAGIE